MYSGHCIARHNEQLYVKVGTGQPDTVGSMHSGHWVARYSGQLCIVATGQPGRVHGQHTQWAATLLNPKYEQKRLRVNRKQMCIHCKNY
jgi:hypothetical protein